MSLFRVGQKVICIRSGIPDHDCVPPVVGATYIVRGIYGPRLPGEYGPTGIWLVELVNPPVLIGSILLEPSFWEECFRPINERETDIGFAYEILRRATTKTTQPAS